MAHFSLYWDTIHTEHPRNSKDNLKHLFIWIVVAEWLGLGITFLIFHFQKCPNLHKFSLSCSQIDFLYYKYSFFTSSIKKKKKKKKIFYHFIYQINWQMFCTFHWLFNFIGTFVQIKFFFGLFVWKLEDLKNQVFCDKLCWDREPNSHPFPVSLVGPLFWKKTKKKHVFVVVLFFFFFISAWVCNELHNVFVNVKDHFST